MKPAFRIKVPSPIKVKDAALSYRWVTDCDGRWEQRLERHRQDPDENDGPLEPHYHIEITDGKVRQSYCLLGPIPEPFYRPSHDWVNWEGVEIEEDKEEP